MEDSKYYVKQCFHCKEPNIYTGDMGYYRCRACEKMTICIIMTKENWEKQIEERKQRWEHTDSQKEKD